jgi:alpha-glucosidase
VVFTTGIQHLADSVKSYEALPAEPKQFLRQVPSAWDETRALSGEPGKSVVVVRRAGTVWYVGGLNADAAQTARIALTFLPAGSFQMTLVRDGADDRSFDSSTRTVTSKETIDVPMRARGGFVIRIVQ